MRLLTLVTLLALLSACTYVDNRDGVLFTSEPPGARIWIDGEDTGYTTPKQLNIGGVFGFDHEIRMTMPGYRPGTRRIYQYTEGYTSRWIDGVYDPVMPPLPLFWTFGDFFLPFGIRAAIVPGALHIKLYREDAPLLGFELLEARRQAQRTADDGTTAPK